MSYATATELLIRFDSDEIAQRADRMVPRLVTDEMLRIAAAGGDLSGFAPEERAAIARAMEKVDRALADARNTIDSYIAGRYTLPLSSVPQVLIRIACELARYYLYDDQFTETVKQRYDANIKFLVGVASGDVKLGVDAESGVEPAGGAGAELYTAGRIWDRRSSGGFL
ncbi:gp436 family protein [Achromobacter xylosoxidans]|uniref:gp436 family protein n=1 Tax=Alcaligenes xylosoxydans xylosoxydans TaxID=85698 RepID=UPI00073523A2|nr:phage protein Gp36 family protein [Achromobacter xylosoxidans]